MDGLCGNVGPHRLPQVHLLVVSMESTAQYWRSVWLELEPHMRLHLAQAFSNCAPRGRKHDFKDSERLVRRLMANKLILSLVPYGEQRIWRSMTRMKLQLTRDRVRLQNQIECLMSAISRSPNTGTPLTKLTSLDTSQLLISNKFPVCNAGNIEKLGSISA
jgi:hypothetical protein